VEEYNYYPYGLVFGASSRSSTIKKTDYLYNGKELQHNEFGAGNGLELTDYGARLYDAQIGRWTQVDPHADRYPDMSGYIPFADSPINIVDLDGRDIIVLRESGAALGTGHGAILVGNDKTGWTYISKDGHEGSFLGTHSSNYPSFWGASSSKYVVRQFKTVAQFRNSPHNFQLVSGAHSTTSGTEASTFNYAVDKKGNKIQRYDKALYIKTMQTDGSSTDKKTIEAASKSAKSDYCFMYADCSDVITEGLNVSENARGEQIQNGESLNYQNDDIFNPDESNYSEWPNSKYNNIEERNKDAIDASAGLIPDN
jgi:RHS repeat-associated protein